MLFRSGGGSGVETRQRRHSRGRIRCSRLSRAASVVCGRGEHGCATRAHAPRKVGAQDLKKTQSGTPQPWKEQTQPVAARSKGRPGAGGLRV